MGLLATGRWQSPSAGRACSPTPPNELWWCGRRPQQFTDRKPIALRHVRHFWSGPNVVARKVNRSGVLRASALLEDALAREPIQDAALAVLLSQEKNKIAFA